MSLTQEFEEVTNFSTCVMGYLLKMIDEKRHAYVYILSIQYFFYKLSITIYC